MTAFEMLLAEIQGTCGLTPEQAQRVRVVFSSWERQALRVPSAKRFLMADVRAAARRMLDAGERRPIIRDRLMSMGVSRRAAYDVIEEALQARISA